MGYDISIDRETHEEYRENPAEFFKKRIEEAETDSVEEFWKERLRLFEKEEKGMNGELDKRERAIEKARVLAKSLREGPSRFEEMRWRAHDVVEVVHSSARPFLKKTLKLLRALLHGLWKNSELLAYPAVVIGAIYALFYCVEYGLGLQAFWGLAVTVLSLFVMGAIDEHNGSAAGRNVIAGAHVVLVIIFTHVVSLAPSQSFSEKPETRENLGVVFHEETRQVERLIDGRSKFVIPVFEEPETVEWYALGYDDQREEIVMSVEEGNTQMTVHYVASPVVEVGDVLNEVNSTGDLHGAVQEEITSLATNFMANVLSEGVEEVSRTQVSRLRERIEQIRNEIFQVEVVGVDLKQERKVENGATQVTNWSFEF